MLLIPLCSYFKLVISCYFRKRMVTMHVQISLWGFVHVSSESIFLSTDLSFQDQVNFTSSVSNDKSPLLIPITIWKTKVQAKKSASFTTVGTLTRSNILESGYNQVMMLTRPCCYIMLKDVNATVMLKNTKTRISVKSLQLRWMQEDFRG